MPSARIMNCLRDFGEIRSIHSRWAVYDPSGHGMIRVLGRLSAIRYAIINGKGSPPQIIGENFHDFIQPESYLEREGGLAGIDAFRLGLSGHPLH